MAAVVGILNGKAGVSSVAESNAGRQHLANGAYDSVPYSLYRCVWSDGTIDEALEPGDFGGELQRTYTTTPTGNTLKLNHPHIP
jgi:hypothetical protein